MKLRQKIINKAIAAEKNKILQHFVRDPAGALGHLLMRCGIQFKRSNDEFEIELSSNDNIIISVKKKTT
jgi:hypothetical protein